VPHAQPSPPHVSAAPPSHSLCSKGVSNQRPLQVASTSYLPQPPSATYPPPSHVSGGAPRPQKSFAGAPPQPSTYLPPDQREVHDSEPPHSTGYVPSTSTSNIPYEEDQTLLSSDLAYCGEEGGEDGRAPCGVRLEGSRVMLPVETIVSHGSLESGGGKDQRLVVILGMIKKSLGCVNKAKSI
jgi:hypothetical protein